MKKLLPLVLLFLFNVKGNCQEIKNAVNLGGPRFGATLISDKLSSEYNLNPIISQFGWQFETKVQVNNAGDAFVIELIPLVGGFEAGKFIPSLTGIIGYRSFGGLEIGFGPNISPVGTSLAFVVGLTFSNEFVNIPVNFAVVPNSEYGFRFSLLTGFNFINKK